MLGRAWSELVCDRWRARVPEPRQVSDSSIGHLDMKRVGVGHRHARSATEGAAREPATEASGPTRNRVDPLRGVYPVQSRRGRDFQEITLGSDMNEGSPPSRGTKPLTLTCRGPSV